MIHDCTLHLYSIDGLNERYACAICGKPFSRSKRFYRIQDEPDGVKV